MTKRGMTGQEQVSETLERIYRAALDEKLWHETLGGVTTLFGGEGSVLVRARDGEGGPELIWIKDHPKRRRTACPATCSAGLDPQLAAFGAAILGCRIGEPHL